MKKLIWIMSQIILTPLSFVLIVLQWFAGSIVGLVEVFYILTFRYELWANNYPKGSLSNCPHKKTLLEVYKEASRNYL